MKRAFTMLEVVFVIVIVGILAIATAPRLNDNRLDELANQIISDMRYVQHLAMGDNKFDPSDGDVATDGNGAWFEKRWAIRFQKCTGVTVNEFFYFIYFDKNGLGGAVARDDTARDPQNGKRYFNGGGSGSGCVQNTLDTSRVMIGNEFGITGVTTTCGGQTLYFDYLGRVHTSQTNMYNSILLTDCNLTLTNDDGESVTITIAPETGYAYINRN